MTENNGAPGLIALLGSGETALAGGRIFEQIAKKFSPPVQVAILETPAGFEPNSFQVAERVASYLKKRLQNYSPSITIIPARKRGTPFSPDDPHLLKPLAAANIIFMGPGSPTYAVRQLKNSLAWDLIRARHSQGAALVFSSAATIAISDWALPVYEIFKVGEDVHAKSGLSLFSDFGSPLSFIPHWNNAEGGEELDTSRCYIGMDRYLEWRAQLPPNSMVIGLDEHTGLIFDFNAQECSIHGIGSITLSADTVCEVIPSLNRFNFSRLGEISSHPEHTTLTSLETLFAEYQGVSFDNSPPHVVLELLEKRQRAREQNDWEFSDRLRDELYSLGWQVQDTPDGQKLVKRSDD